MPEPYKPNGSDVTYTVPSLDDPADGPQAFRDFADSIPADLSAAIPVEIKTADYTLALKDAGAAVFFDTTAESHKVTVPAHSSVAFPVGSAIVIGNVGTNKDGNVQITPADGVTVRDTAVRKVGLNRMAVILQVEQDSWIINAGTGGGPAPGTVPSPPKLISAIGGPECAYLNWEAPKDDGGHDITTYTVERSTDQVSWTLCAQADPSTLSAQVKDLTSGTKYFFRVKAANIIGLSDPSNVMDATPKDDYNDASGGTVTTYTKDGRTYRVHTFSSSGTLSVKKAAVPFRVLVVGGGGAAGGGRSGGGGGGALRGAAVPLGTGDNAVSVGGPGQASAFAGLSGQAGGNGGANGVAGGPGACGGGGGTIQQNENPFGPGGGKGSQGFDGSFGCGDNGGNGGGGGGGGMGSAARPSNYDQQFGWNLRGGGGGAGLVDDITGSLVEYAPGGSGTGLSGNVPRFGTWGGPGSGGGTEGPAQGGVVIVSYEIAPYNDASGGTVSYFSKAGKFYKQHTFTASGTLEVRASNQPWNVFAVAGGGHGGNGFIADIGYQGFKGGGGGAFEQDISGVTVGSFQITVGTGGANGGNFGNDSKVFTLTVGGGGPGGSTACAGSPFPSGPTPGRDGSVGGTSKGGTGGGCTTQSTFPAYPLLDARGLARTFGDGGGGGAQEGDTAGKPGNPGIVVITYEVASAPADVLLLSEDAWRVREAGE